MPDSDDEYIQTLSDDEADAHQVNRGTGRKTRTNAGSATRGAGREGTGAGGFEVSRTWENVEEGADGTISGAIEDLLEAGKRKRLLKDTTPLQRGIIRHLVLVIDLSAAMLEKDLRPSRHLLTIAYAQQFVNEYFEQNPISQLGIIGMRDGLAVRVSDMSGNPTDHVSALQRTRDQEPKGQPSLQNALEMTRGILFNAPSHGTREVMLVLGSLLSSDPGDIHTTITALVKAKITCTVIGLAAEIAICRTLVTRTNPSINSASLYNVALNEQHYRELIMAATTPPPTAAPDPTTTDSTTGSNNSTLLMMGFPSRIVEPFESFCACHSKPTRGGYLCSRCRSKVCDLPTTCPTCGLTLILSTHLARSYHHLFPLQNWTEVSWAGAAKRPGQHACFACMTPFPEIPSAADSEKRRLGGEKLKDGGERSKKAGGVSESGRYECGTCHRFFCIDCDVYCHEVVHNCPGCLSGNDMLVDGNEAVGSAGVEEEREAMDQS